MRPGAPSAERAPLDARALAKRLALRVAVVVVAFTAPAASFHGTTWGLALTLVLWIPL